jgi:acyl-CoA thioesterase-1
VKTYATAATFSLTIASLLSLGLTIACSSSSGTNSGPDGGSNGDVATKPAPIPNPIISRRKMVYSSPAGGAALVDGLYHNGGWSAGVPTAAAPAWAAINLGAGPTRVLVSWDDGGTYNYTPNIYDTANYGFPSAYEIDVSADSTNGTDGTWTPSVTVVDNNYRTRAHSIDFTGQSWVKMLITAESTSLPEPNGVQISEIDVHDISATGAGLPDDTWFFMGDSITAFAFDRASSHAPSFADLVHTDSPNYFPAMINGGVGGELSRDGLARLATTLTINPDYRYFTLNYGTNDSAGMQVSPAVFGTTMQSMITMLIAAGRTPIIPHIPYSGDGTHGSIPAYNTVIDTLTATNNLMTGPDLYTFFFNNSAGSMDAAGTDDFVCPPCGSGRTTDHIHPNDVGLTEMSLLWEQAMRPIYP